MEWDVGLFDNELESVNGDLEWYGFNDGGAHDAPRHVDGL